MASKIIAWRKKPPEDAPSPGQAALAGVATLEEMKKEIKFFADEVFRPELQIALAGLEERLIRRLGSHDLHASRHGSKSPPRVVEGIAENPALQKVMLRSSTTTSKVSHASSRAHSKQYDQDDWVGRVRQGMQNRGSELASQMKKRSSSSVSQRSYLKVMEGESHHAGTLGAPRAESERSAPLCMSPRTAERQEAFRASARRMITMDVEQPQHGLFQFAEPQSARFWHTDIVVEPEHDVPESKGTLTMIMRSRTVEYIAALVIMANMFFMGFQADFALKHIGMEEPQIYDRISLGFCAVFAVELILRLLAERLDFFCGEDIFWNLLDFSLVSLQVIDEVLPRVSPALSDKGGNFSFLRVLRVLRTVRILRVVRMCKFVSELRVLLVTLNGSMRSLFWTVILLIYLTSCMGLYITQVIKERQDKDPFDSAEEEAIKEFFGSMSGTMWSLYLSVSNGIEWEKLCMVLATHVSPVTRPVFGLYIAFTVFALLNIITGIFMNSAIASADADRHENLVEQMKRTFENTDTDNSGSISVAEFEMHLTDPEMQVYLRGLGWRSDQAMELFNMLDVDGSGEINVGEFLAGCTRLQGVTKAVDFAAFMFEFNRLKCRITEYIETMEVKYLRDEPSVQRSLVSH